MEGLKRNAPQLPVVLAISVLWACFAWGLAADAPPGGGEAEVPEDPWAGVKVSDAYDYAKCPECGYKNEIRAESYARCGYELPQPSADMADSDMVFVPGMGYFAEGTILEPAKVGKYLWIKGLVLTAAGVYIYSVGRQYFELNNDRGGSFWH